jgi:hypothetical protein
VLAFRRQFAFPLNGVIDPSQFVQRDCDAAIRRGGLLLCKNPDCDGVSMDVRREC